MAKALMRLGNTIVTRGPTVTLKTLQYSSERLRVFWKYARVEMLPPTPGEISASIGQAKNALSLKTIGSYTVKEGLINAVIGAEILCWFFVGEIIGRKSIIGYNHDNTKAIKLKMPGFIERLEFPLLYDSGLHHAGKFAS